MTGHARHFCALTRLPDTVTSEIEIMPLGEFRLADGRGKVAMRVEDPAALIAASFAAAPGEEGARALPIDFDHRSFADQGTADSRAAGWITALRADGDRIVAAVEWTPAGRAALEERSYRFVSPVFKATKAGRVMLIEGAGLVNTPALPQLKQLASKVSEENGMDPLDEIANLLGLSVDTPEDIIARIGAALEAETHLASIAEAAGETGDDAVTRIAARLKGGAPDPAAFVPMAAFAELQTQFASLKADTEAAKVEAALQAARDEGKLMPHSEDWARRLASKDLAEFEAWAAQAPVMVAPGARQLAGRVPPARTEALDATERHVAAMMGVNEDAFLATRKQEV
ncbi:Mu-like prophage I protein [Rhodovulum sp. P5]|uniref:head maturation protease n=1 Tax=Rhodovulum phage vB_RhkS_P1 TaxID=1873452 RepID=UPI00080AB50C|nr:phage protease [Rhodovulum sp. P5]YP_009285922.1 head maturation protease [Rhodovulum phage vB_RhkS_P1]ANT39908.1 hypothetical protein Rhks_37 [Rhodovulum phage vB_RhkS_P1]ARE38976.1 Mu-like prophage I protein [Rhodovulum sp. P5]